MADKNKGKVMHSRKGNASAADSTLTITQKEVYFEEPYMDA